jgi:hypothetical protein
MAQKNLIPYSVYLPIEYHKRLKAEAQYRKAASLVRDAIITMLDGGDLFKSGYNKAVKDAAKVIYESKEAQMIAVNKKDLGAILTEKIELLHMK